MRRGQPSKRRDCEQIASASSLGGGIGSIHPQMLDEWMLRFAEMPHYFAVTLLPITTSVEVDLLLQFRLFSVL